MWRFSVGEEVTWGGRVYVVSARSAEPPRRYRLVASRPEGARFVWADESELGGIDAYLEASDDTERI